MTARFTFALVAIGFPAIACAKPATSSERDYPAPVSVGKTPAGPVYVDGKRKTLYTMSIRWAQARSGVGIEYCSAACLAAWTPLLAGPEAKLVGDWTVIQGPKGLQWAHKRNPVFSFNEDRKPGETRGDGYDYLWSTLFYAPRRPDIQAPPSVAITAVGGVNILTNLEGRALFTASSRQAADYKPFAAAMASQSIGAWTVLRDRDAPQWAWRNRPVFVSQEASPTDAPSGGAVIRP